MNDFEQALVAFLGEERLKKIRTVKVGIAGAGGIGSNCALNLVRSGFNNLKIIDFDKIEYSNLNRQFYFYHQVGCSKVKTLKENLLSINPNLKIEILNIKLDEKNAAEIFADCDVVIEAFDKVLYKKILVEEFANSIKLLIAVSGIAGWDDVDDIKVHKIKDNFFIVGDLVTEVSNDKPPISPKVNVAAAKMANLVLKFAADGR